MAKKPNADKATEAEAAETAKLDVEASQLTDNTTGEDDPKSNVETDDEAHGGIRESITAGDIDGPDEDDEAEEEGFGDLEDDEDAVETVETGNGVVAGNGEIQTFISGNADAAVGGDGVTGKSNDGQTYVSPDGATGADTHAGGLGIGTTPVAPIPQTADALVASVAHPARVEAAVLEVISDFASNPQGKTVGAAHNLFDDLGMHRADLAAFAARLNEEFGTTLTVGEAQNFLLVRDVQNMMKRKLAVAAALA